VYGNRALFYVFFDEMQSGMKFSISGKSALGDVKKVESVTANYVERGSGLHKLAASALINVLQYESLLV
jgi:hypothetical protein